MVGYPADVIGFCDWLVTIGYHITVVYYFVAAQGERYTVVGTTA